MFAQPIDYLLLPMQLNIWPNNVNVNQTDEKLQQQNIQMKRSLNIQLDYLLTHLAPLNEVFSITRCSLSGWLIWILNFILWSIVHGI